VTSFLNRLLKNSNLIFLVAFLFGLFLGNYATLLQGYLLPALVLIMSLSTTQVTLTELTHVKKYIWDILLVFIIPYPL